MARRDKAIATSICHSILASESYEQPSLSQRIPAFFYTYSLIFACLYEELFTSLREIWHLDEQSYFDSFRAGSKDALVPMGDMGYSGSTFFTTSDGKYLVKSIPRHFEHSFFKDDLLMPYAEHMRQHRLSLLVRITDFLENTHASVGTMVGLAPSHHIVMENLKFGEKDDKRDVEWETWDLKPMSYFYPERDVADGKLTSEATKSKLADDFDEKLVLSTENAAALREQLQKDTAFLAECNAVDYSLFLVRVPADTSSKPQGELEVPMEPPLIPPGPPSWRTGMKSADGKWVYRASILDFFWAKHKVHAQAMTGLIKTYNIVDKQGPMSVTTNSQEYRERFLKMCDEMIEVK